MKLTRLVDSFFSYPCVLYLLLVVTTLEREFMFELLQMWLLVEVLGFCGLPLAFALFRNLPDRGWAFSKMVGLVLFAFLTWLPLVSLRFLPYNRLFLLGIVLTMCAFSGLLYCNKWSALLALARKHLAYVVALEIVFAGMVALLGLLRSFKPDIQGYEMFMDEGFIASIIRSTHLPPNDMWFSGHSINYYYYAHYVLATLAKLLGQPPAIAFNTGISLCFGLTALCLFGVTCNIVALGRSFYKRSASRTDADPDGQSMFVALWPAIPFGLLSMVMALVFGNLAATQQWWEKHDVPYARFDWFAPSRVIKDTINEFPAFSFILSCFHAHVLTLAFTIFCLALALNLLLEPAGRGFAIFGWGRRLWLNLAVTVITLGGLYVMNGWDYPTYMGLTLVCIAVQQLLAHNLRFSRLLCAHIVLVSGTLIALSFLAFLPFHLQFVSPSQGYGIVPASNHSALGDELLIYGFFAFVFLSLLFATLWRQPVRALLRQPFRGTIAPADLAALSPVLVEHVPEDAGSITYADGSQGYAFSMTPPSSQSGATGAVAVALPDANAEEALPDDHPSLILASLDLSPPPEKDGGQRVRLVASGVMALIGLLCLALALLLPGSLTIVLGCALALVATLLLFYVLGNRAHAFTLLLGAVAFTIIAGCEVFYLKDIFASSSALRMNTVFKFYFQAWALLSIASAAGLYFIVERFWQVRAGRKLWRGVGYSLIAGWSCVFLLLFGASMVYPLTAPFARYSQYDALHVTPYLSTGYSLDGLAYLRTCDKPFCPFTTYGDYQAINWLNTHIEGDPILVEGIGAEYQYGGRVSTFTGLPTLMGWPGHETQWRMNWFKDKVGNYEDFQRRGLDLDVIYTDPHSSMVLSTLARYNAQYLYVGPYEFQKYPDTDLHRFAAFMQVVYEADGVTVYKVRD